MEIISKSYLSLLPSVGKGDVLNQLIKSGVVPVAKLTETFRQKKGSLIVDNAYKVNNGDTNLEFDQDTFALYRLEDTENDMERFKKFYASKIKQYGVENVMILCPRRRAVEGKKLFFVSDTINKVLQDVANPKDDSKPEAKVKVASGEVLFRVGDRLMQWKNKKDSSNGDIGTLKDIMMVDGEVNFVIEWEVDKSISRYNFSDMESITLAYSMSIHKSQGSEAQCVIMPFMKEHKSPLFQRNLLYTGITRAKKECIIVGDKESVDTCIKTEVTGTRVSYLSQRLQMRYQENQTKK